MTPSEPAPFLPFPVVGLGASAGGLQALETFFAAVPIDSGTAFVVITHQQNEELQSANEELETSREEMQSLNEELQTVNVELEQRNRALSQTNDDMQNLLNSTDIATVFLDEKLSIKRFTTQATKVFNLIETDIGRPIADLVANLRDDRLLDDAAAVLRTLVFHEREIQTKEGAWRLMRIMPYRTHDNLIDGLVLTFIDIDRIKLTEQREQVARARAEAVIDAVPNPLLVLEASLHISSAKPGLLRTLSSHAQARGR
jgi:two-component system, chemotaxis family, CheB/CheR fusion protein